MRIDLAGLACGYPGADPLFEDLTVCLSAASWTSVLGSNGVGKTTLIRALMGLQPPLAGQVLMDGRPLVELSRQQIARKVGYVPQTQHNPFGFPVLDVVLMGRTVHVSRFGQPGSSDRRACHEVLGSLGIDALADRPFTELSGGEQQLVMIARALVQEPSLVIFDEPTASLDLGNQARALRHMQRLVADGLGVVMTTHAPEQALSGDQVILLQRGAQPIVGATEAVLTSKHLSHAYGIPVAVSRRIEDGEPVTHIRSVDPPDPPDLPQPQGKPSQH
ncbi:MAG: ABC transporter ATP-binding protein [Propioniciclava sp.]